MMNTNNILLLTDVPPCENYSGGAFLNQLSEMLIDEKVELYGFFMIPNNLNIIFNQYVKNKIDFKIVSYLNDQYIDIESKENYLRELDKIAINCVDFIKQNKITKIWCYIQCENILRLLDCVYQKTGIPYVSQIMDPIDWHIKARGFNNNRKKEVLSLFDKVISNSKYCLTASENMYDIYSNKYNIHCDYITVSHDQNIVLHKKSAAEFTISLAGQIYCIEEFNNLLRALEKLNWECNGKKIILKYFGGFDLITHIKTNNIIAKDNYDKVFDKGYLSQRQLDIELNNSDLLYCPYFFSDDEALKKVSEQSFPSKLISYLNTNTNVLVHGPDYSSPVMFLKKHKCGFTISSNNVDKIAKQLKKVITNTPFEQYLNNAKDVFKNNFTRNKIKQKFLKAFNIKFDENADENKLTILEVNNIDVFGGRFNGYDMIGPINKDEKHILNQIVTYKISENKNVYKFYENNRIEQLEYNYRDFENNVLSVHSEFSIIGELLLNTEVFNKSNFIHYHLVHNTKIPLPALTNIFSLKPTVITIHDPWNFTGRCVYPLECEEWKTGCKKCNYLDTLFPFKLDNCQYLWKQKEKFTKQWDIDIIVSTNYLNETFIKESPITKHFKNVHVLPFGIDLDLFKDNNNKAEIREKLKIPQNDTVIFVRSQKGIKCAEEIKEALKLIKSEKSITIITCSEVGNFDDLKHKYNFLELGNIGDAKIVEAFNACDFFLMPTKGETFGVMAIEAMACSRAIVVFDNMTLPQVTFAPDCGVLVENMNVKKLAEAINYLIDNEEERIRRGKLGRELAEKHYDVKTFNKKLVKIYESAFERQKYKLNNTDIKPVDMLYNSSNTNVRKLIWAIRQNHKSIFNDIADIDMKFNFDSLDLSGEHFDKYVYNTIDYSDDEVAKFINYFNHTVYLQYKDIVNFSYNTICNTAGDVILVSSEEANPAQDRSKIFKLYYYIRNDRYRLKQAVKWRLAGKPKLYAFSKKTYEFLKNVKRKMHFNYSINNEAGTANNGKVRKPLKDRSKIYKMIYYIRYDRFMLKEAVKWRLEDKPKLYAFAARIYALLVNIKRNIQS